MRRYVTFYKIDPKLFRFLFPKPVFPRRRDSRLVRRRQLRFERRHADDPATRVPEPKPPTADVGVVAGVVDRQRPGHRGPGSPKSQVQDLDR